MRLAVDRSVHQLRRQRASTKKKGESPDRQPERKGQSGRKIESWKVLSIAGGVIVLRSCRDWGLSQSAERSFDGKPGCSTTMRRPL